MDEEEKKSRMMNIIFISIRMVMYRGLEWREVSYWVVKVLIMTIGMYDDMDQFSYPYLCRSLEAA